jgi:hypothetical protein
MLSETIFSCQVRQSCCDSVWISIQTPGARLRWRLPSGLRFLPSRFHLGRRYSCCVARLARRRLGNQEVLLQHRSDAAMLRTLPRTEAEEAREGDSLDCLFACCCFPVCEQERKSATFFEAERVIISCQFDWLSKPRETPRFADWCEGRYLLPAPPCWEEPRSFASRPSLTTTPPQRGNDAREPRQPSIDSRVGCGRESPGRNDSPATTTTFRRRARVEDRRLGKIWARNSSLLKLRYRGKRKSQPTSSC